MVDQDWETKPMKHHILLILITLAFLHFVLSVMHATIDTEQYNV